MDPEPEVMEQPPEEIRQQIDLTRSALTEKLETLESEVRETVHNVTETVEQTIGTVKETVEGTVETVKRTFDLEYQVDRHPWAMLGGSVVAGCLAGMFVGGMRPRQRSAGLATLAPNTLPSDEPYAEEYVTAPRVEPSGPSWWNRFLHQFEGEIGQIKELAIGTAMGLARDFIKESVPHSIEEKVTEVLDSVTSKLGGRPVEGPVADSVSAGHARARADQPAW